MTKSEYKRLVKEISKPSPCLKNTASAYLTGGIICVIGELLYKLYAALGANDSVTPSLVSITLIFIAVTLTALDVFDNIAKFGGAGTLVPITGFANAVAAPAIDTKAEGWVTGVGAKIFTIAGPVILYGTLTSVIYGVIYSAYKLFAMR